MSAENVLLTELDQQYQQYRHLDNLRERYVAFYIALITAVFLSDKDGFVIFILLIIGLVVLEMSILIRIAQRMTADHLMEIKKDLFKIIKLNDDNIVLNSFLMATYKPYEKYRCVQNGWDFKESAIQLIVLLMVINSIIGAYFIKDVVGFDFDLSGLVFVLLMVLQLLHFIHRFCSGLSPKKRKERKANMCEYLKNETKLRIIECE
ncbi:MAG: hypothetical protein KAT05_05020 [Spirochaetes bacterium]|nr:hypothetical protein [Spirochaetota bacterium]